MEKSSFIPTSQSEREDNPLYDEPHRIPVDYIDPVSAGNSASEFLEIEDIVIPVAFVQNAEGNFRVSGVQESTKAGVVISGRIASGMAKINHLFVDESLRRTGVTDLLYTTAEKSLADEGVKIIYAGFYNPGSVKVFLRNGYKVISTDSLSEEVKTSLKLNPADFGTDKKILMEKEVVTYKNKPEE